MTIFVMSGIPASGKTTYSHQLAKQYEAVIYCYDELKKNTKYFYELSKVRHKMYNDVLNDLNQQRNVIIDDLNIAKSMRIELLSYLQFVPCKKVCIVMTTSFEECLQRDSIRSNKLPEYILRNIYEKYEIPTLDEGWDEIIYI